jgi:uncharacterized linocin/CFP29 family protein
MPNDPQVSWTDEQWARVNQVIQDEARHARVSATFLPLYGPLPPDSDFVKSETIAYPPRPQPPPPRRIEIADRAVIQLATLQVKVEVRGAQMADPDMTSVLALFRRAANVLARLEDAVVFRGLVPAALPRRFQPPAGTAGLPTIWEITGGELSRGLWDPNPPNTPIPVLPPTRGTSLVKAVSGAIGMLERKGHFGPFAVVLGEALFNAAQTPDKGSLVLPQDRIIPFLGGGSLLRSSTLYSGTGVVVALGGTPVELIVATDVSLQFLQVTGEPNFLFRVFEKMVLRIKESDAIMQLKWQP